MTTIISIIYYAFIAFIVILIVYNLIRAKEWKKELIYLVILIPFLLRMLMLK
ncbi:MAG: hypothetical protein M0P69_09510 [Bacteroidales bacterium]|jgi:hypothetical protein|nr:hypothetical protein [Bacteroidales bacterium]MDD2570351.1 hypothetical protein [Bacteroidales bacterium]MDD2813952.1 hypothetical protein [Bacteroidales bacterium]MDD3385120.1 hypothetical protein [Bacteroidales bacterium]MDD3812887.1 hypothetical protein [Bacteroidales bacterium]